MFQKNGAIQKNLRCVLERKHTNPTKGHRNNQQKEKEN